MANLLLIHDPSVERRQRFVDQAYPRLALLPGLRSDQAACGDASLLWCAAPTAPLSRHGEADSLAFVMGDPHDSSGARYDARALGSRCGKGLDTPGDGNGFYGAVFIHARDGIRVEADVLGVFPWYYWSSGDVFLAGTSPALFPLHPCFEARLDPAGLACLIQIGAAPLGPTLWAGVRRLAADHVLRFEPGRGGREVSPAPLIGEEPRASAKEYVDFFADLHREFLHRAIPSGSRTGILMSGGLDTRILAGTTHAMGHRPHAFTFGRPADLEAGCARGVSTELAFPQTIRDIAPEEYPEHAALSTNWENLANGLYSIPLGWNLALTPREPLTDRMISGMLLDAVTGGPKKDPTRVEGIRFEDLHASWLGLNQDEIARFVHDSELRDACAWVRDSVLNLYRDSFPSPHLRGWALNLRIRQRFPVGSSLWRFSFHSWPVLPALDRRLIRCCASAPAEFVERRRLQRELLIRHYPRLARLPIDTNYFDTTPLIPSPRTRWNNLRRRGLKLARRMRMWAGHDPRFYERAKDFNSPGWRRIRASAEPFRSTLHAWFTPGRLDELLPGPTASPRRSKDALTGSTPLKNLVALMLWSAPEGPGASPLPKRTEPDQSRPAAV